MLPRSTTHDYGDKALMPAERDQSLIVTTSGFDCLSSSDLNRWEAIRFERPKFSHPFYSTTFAQSVQNARGDVIVVIVRRGDQAIGFLPIHRTGNSCWPVGRCFNDAHGLITDSNQQISLKWILSQIGAKAFHFHALSGGDVKAESNECFATIPTFCLPVGDDSKKALIMLEKRHVTIRRQEQKTRKLNREVGTVDFEMDCRDTRVLETLIQFKRDQYFRTGMIDLFYPKWTRIMLRSLHDRPRTGAHGVLSVLRAGNRIVAAHYGIREGDFLHYWFPAYCSDYARYSPGTALFKSIVQNASDVGIRLIDMGYGEQPYKRKQTDTQSEVRLGVIARSRSYRCLEHAKYQTKEYMRQIPCKQTIKKTLRRISPHGGLDRLS